MARQKDEGKDKSGNKKKMRDKSVVKELKKKSKKKNKQMKKQTEPENVGEVKDNYLSESQIDKPILPEVCIDQDFSDIFYSKEVSEIKAMDDSVIKSFLGEFKEFEKIKIDLEKEKGEHEHSGFQNLGNTCYFNSLMQTLASCFVFKKAVIELEIPKDFYHFT